MDMDRLGASAPSAFDYGAAVRGLEGFRSRPYWDHKHWSVGYGTRASGPDDVIDEVEGRRRFDAAFGRALSTVDAFKPGLDPGTRHALASLTYNAGDAWTRSGLGAAIRAGDLDRARTSFLQYINASGQPNAGLQSRRAQEVAWFGGPAPATASTPSALAPRMALGGPPSTPSAPMAQPSTLWTPEDNIARTDRAAQQMARIDPGVGRMGGLAAALSALGSGLLSTSANAATLSNQTMRGDAMRSAANAPDNVSMGRMLMAGGVPGLEDMGLKTIMTERSEDAARRARLEQEKALLNIRGAHELSMIAPRTEADIAKARALMPVEVEKAKAIGTAADEVAAAKEARLRRERAAAAASVGMDPKSREYISYVLTGSVGKDPTKSLSVGDITKLSDEGGKFRNAMTFSETFREPFAGYTIGGEMAMGARRLGIPGSQLFASQEAAEWWQQYDRYKNQIRNDLFGSALTRTEQAAFEKADIRPNMDPAIIRKNLEEQAKIIREGVKRKAMALIASGYDADAVASSFGVDLTRDLGVARTKAENTPGAPGAAPGVRGKTPETAIPVTSPAEAGKLPSGTFIKMPDGSTGRVP